MTGPRLKRRPDDGGYARGDATRELIITTAIAVFGERGFDGASTRMLVEPAGASPAAIQYYFGGKVGLYRACAEYLAEHAWRKIDEDARALDEVALDAGPDVLIDTLADFFAAQEATLHKDPVMAQRSLFLMREQTSSSGPAFDIIFDKLNRPVLVKFARIVGAIIGKPQDAPETRLRTAMMIAQMTGMRTHGQIILRFMEWPDFSGNRLEMWQSVMRAHLRATLSAAIADISHACRPPRPGDEG